MVALLLVAGCGGGGGGGSSTPAAAPGGVLSPSPTSTTLTLNVTQGYTATGMYLASGTQYTITASGTLQWAAAPCVNCTVSPSGSPWSTCSSRQPPAYPAPGLACWSLIGKIGASGTPFEIGTSLNSTVPAGVSGELYVGVNDNDLTDNSGSWTVAINQTAP